MLRYILLGFLSYQPMSGYDMKRLMDVSTTHFWHAYHSQIYATLRKMEQDGLVTSEIDASEDKLERRIYMLTPTGTVALDEWLKQPLMEVPQSKDDLMVRLFFSARRDKAEVLDELRLQRRLHQQQLDLYADISPEFYAEQMQMMTGGDDFSHDAKFWAMTVAHGREYEAMYVHWLDQTIRELEAI